MNREVAEMKVWRESGDPICFNKRSIVVVVIKSSSKKNIPSSVGFNWASFDKSFEESITHMVN